MLARSNRLRRTRDVRRVLRGGRFFSEPCLALHVAPAGSGRRCTVVASRKVGGAVVRNRVRRRLRELLRIRLGQWREGFDAVLVARPPAAGMASAELGLALDSAAQRAALAPAGESTAGPYELPRRRKRSSAESTGA